MEGRLPPEGDDLFEWTDAPARPPTPPREPVPAEGGRPGTGESAAVESPPSPSPTPTPTPDTAERRRIRGDTGEFERSGRRPPPGRRARRRDLPAKVRRRQDFMVGGVAAIVIIALIVLISSSGGGSSEQPVPLKRLVGQSIVAKLGSKGPDQALVKRVRHGQVGGLITFETDPQKLKSDVQKLQSAASAGGNPPLLVMVDQEGGDVKRLKSGPPTISPADLGKSGDEGQAKDQGQQTGSFLRGLGVNVDLAPVLDVSQPQTAQSIKSRTFGSDPAVVSKVGVPFAQGLQDGGTVATAKHFPGLGRATVSTDDRPVTIAATSNQLQNDLLPFKAAVGAGVRMVMVSTASYPTLGAKKPAAFSPTIVKTLLRGHLGFDGVTITDDLEAPAVTSTLPPVVAATAALKAGNDLLLYASNTKASENAFGSLVRQVKNGQLDRGVVQAAYDRITSLKDSPTG
ncbi:MAG TPA: glycoside hydrolase family 3 N-terminal domain-containing protein [Solirubrobacterales bacterium]|jgi:beta-N-acetylhexosaminidase|nr:glycoside hydrolase family 3 N-terminal domain-containing protein [Solirubrobacterales bacterium]